MKMKRLLAATILGSLGLVGCGDGVQSPDFTGVLQSLDLTAPDAKADPNSTADFTYVLPVGREVSLSLKGAFTTPPGSPSSTVAVPITKADFTVTPSDAGTVTNNILVGTEVGETIEVVASKDGRTSRTLTFRITPAALDSIAISPSGPVTISEFGSQSYSAIGTFSDGSTAPTQVDWVPANAAVITFDTPRGTQSTASPTAGSAGMSTTFTATSVVDPTLEATGTININNVTISPTSAIVVTCDDPVISAGSGTECRASATFTDGSTMAIADDRLNWSSNNGATAIDAMGVVTTTAAAAATTATIRAELKANTTRFGTTTLVITDSVCTTPFVLGTGATVTPTDDAQSTIIGTGAGTPFSQTCLFCNVTDPASIIDGDGDTFASLTAQLGLLLPRITVSVSDSEIYPAGTTAGFIVAQPTGLLSAELLSSITLQALNGTALAGDPSTTSQPSDPIPVLPLTVTLLGLIGGQDAALVSYQPNAAYNGLALTFNGGVVSALPELNIFQACATATPTAISDGGGFNPTDFLGFLTGLGLSPDDLPAPTPIANLLGALPLDPPSVP